MIKTLFKSIDGEVTRIHAHDYECKKLEKDGFVYSSEEAEAVKPAKTRKSKAVDDERGEGNQASVAEDTGPGA